MHEAGLLVGDEEEIRSTDGHNTDDVHMNGNAMVLVHHASGRSELRGGWTDKLSGHANDIFGVIITIVGIAVVAYATMWILPMLSQTMTNAVANMQIQSSTGSVTTTEMSTLITSLMGNGIMSMAIMLLPIVLIINALIRMMGRDGL